MRSQASNVQQRRPLLSHNTLAHNADRVRLNAMAYNAAIAIRRPQPGATPSTSPRLTPAAAAALKTVSPVHRIRLYYRWSMIGGDSRGDTIRGPRTGQDESDVLTIYSPPPHRTNSPQALLHSQRTSTATMDCFATERDPN